MKDHNPKVVGRVTAPKGFESTLDHVYFWAEPGSFVEKSCPVVIRSTVQAEGGFRDVEFIAVVDEARYQSVSETIHEDRLRSMDGPASPPHGVQEDGTAYYKAQVLKSNPDLLVAPTGGSEVRLATDQQAREAYGMDEIEWGIPFGLIRAGAERTAGPLLVDPAYSLGENGAHLNMNGTSGIATKTSALNPQMRAAVP